MVKIEVTTSDASKIKRFLEGRYTYEIGFMAEDELKNEFRAKMNQQELVYRELKFESLSPDLATFIFEVVNTTIAALTLLYMIYQDRKKKDAKISIRFPDTTIITVNKIEDLDVALEKLKQIDPKKDAEERKRMIKRFKKIYEETFGDDKN